MNRRSFLLAPLALALFAPQAQAAKISLGELSRYLNAIQTAQADFTQINPDGTISTGRLYIRRPGRMRFEYNKPDDTVVIAGGGQVAIFDGKSNTGPEQYPLKRTPLNLILEQNVDLSRRSMVIGHREDGPKTIVTAQDPEHPEYGNIQLVFTGNPTELRQWIVTDGSGVKTTVVLGQLALGGTLPARLFNITAETDRRGR
ncbi:Outer-membrane lipoprotein carrier protein precursor [Pseudoruegeria aquimaris]|uniref:Outer-membrane lipoprotein carrier protein n=1 Tax=Pseudoruegeria aquimaris TaxID=393663 RepID=A0A1Y5TRU2_9RHOB|nr:outer membrane lipoprotein carrier protein LolA [Pseudoruegeria aquimaris]SLN66741.1 Outer-membrane lipoprotein carrier protein precursor [Pseudoruegeria aquimaris]